MDQKFIISYVQNKIFSHTAAIFFRNIKELGDRVNVPIIVASNL
jgi:hypothetical protein